MNGQADFSEVLEVASEAGHILLENGAEISRVEDIMNRISTHYGVSSGNFFVLSNGIFTTGRADKVTEGGGQASTYANVEFIPIRSPQLSRVSAVNRLSYDIAADRCTLEEAKRRLSAIRYSAPKPFWEQMLAMTVSSGAFAAIFGGSFADCLAASIAGFLLFLFMYFVSTPHLSRIVAGICNATFVTVLCTLCWRFGLGENLSNIVIGAIMPLVPGIAFVNGVRDLANSDYLAGLTRLTDAMLGFFCIAIGVALSFILDGGFFGGLIALGYTESSPQTASLLCQALAALTGTAGFAVLFGVDREQYLGCGLIGMAGWLLYLVLFRYYGQSAPIASLFASFLVCVLARCMAVRRRCPAQIFLICGIFPLVPGAGIFWFSYRLTLGSVAQSATSGFVALKVAVCIVLGIILAMELPQRLFSGRRRRIH